MSTPKWLIAKRSKYYKGKFPITAHPNNKQVIKRLAALRPKSNPYVSSRNYFTTELDHLDSIMHKTQTNNPHMANSKT